MPSGASARALLAPSVDAASLSRLPPELARDVELVRELAVSGKVLEACALGTGMRFTAIARVTATHWVACDVRDGLEFGLAPGGELPVRTTLCDEVVTAASEIVIRDVSNDPVYARHACPATYGFRSYVSVPVRLADGSLFGTLCALDPEPRVLDDAAVLEPVRLHAELIGLQIDAARRHADTRRALHDERALASLREEFIAVVGHDLRNPLGSIDANAQLIELLSEDEGVREANRAILRSSARMCDLVANLMDFARGRLGGGIELAVEWTTTLGDALQDVVSELAVAYPERALDSRFELRLPVRCDPARIAQLLSNLVGNAIAHGAPEQPVEVRGVAADDELRLTVANGGEPIPAAVMDQLFEPFRRAERGRDGRGARDDGRPDDGLGLGLHIAREIALAHDGRIDVESSAERTIFTFRMPTGGACVVRDAPA